MLQAKKASFKLFSKKFEHYFLTLKLASRFAVVSYCLIVGHVRQN